MSDFFYYKKKNVVVDITPHSLTQLSTLVNDANLCGYWNYNSSNGTDYKNLNNMIVSSVTFADSSQNTNFQKMAYFVTGGTSAPHLFKISPSGLPTGNTSFTVNGWIKPTRTPHADGSWGILSWGNTATNQMVNICPVGNTIMFQNYNNDPSVPYTWLINQWQMITCTYTSTDKTVRFYVNAAQTGSTITLPANLALGAVWVDIGIQRLLYKASQFGLCGWVDDVAIWNRVLTAGEITSLYSG